MAACSTRDTMEVDSRMGAVILFRGRVRGMVFAECADERALEVVLRNVKDHGLPELSDHRHMVEAQRLELQQHNVYGNLPEPTMITRKDRASQQQVLCASSLLKLPARSRHSGWQHDAASAR